MKLDSDDFELFDLPRRFAQDRSAIDARWRALQAQVHPDRFATEGAAAQRVAMQWAVRVNEGYRRLKDPLQRAVYLCELNGAAIDAERNTAMPPAFLVTQMNWRESLGEAQSLADVQKLEAEVRDVRATVLKEIETLLDERRDASAAAAQVRALMFIERFAEDIDRRLQALGQ